MPTAGVTILMDRDRFKVARGSVASYAIGGTLT